MCRPQHQNAVFQFRVAEGLLAAAQAKAVRSGVTVSQLIRAAIEREVRSR